MIFKPKIWYPIAVVLSIVNVAAVYFAAQPGEPWHATIHAALALAFGLWAQRLRARRDGSEVDARLEASDALQALAALDAEMSTLRQKLIETQGSLDVAERLAAKAPEAVRVNPPR